MMSVVIGLTGGYQTGKSTVARFFEQHGAKVISLDAIAHQALRSSSPYFKKIVRAFGKDIVVDNRICRKRLGRAVFGNKKRLAKLNALIHPFVIKTMKRELGRLSKKHRWIVVEAPLLFEAGLEHFFDYIVVVEASKAKQMKRAQSHTALSKSDIAKRINSQWSLARKKKKADFIINNNGTQKATRARVRAIMQQVN